MFTIILVVIVVVIVMVIYQSYKVNRIRTQMGNKGEFHRYVVSGKYKKDRYERKRK